MKCEFVLGWSWVVGASLMRVLRMCREAQMDRGMLHARVVGGKKYGFVLAAFEIWVRCGAGMLFVVENRQMTAHWKRLSGMHSWVLDPKFEKCPCECVRIWTGCDLRPGLRVVKCVVKRIWTVRDVRSGRRFIRCIACRYGRSTIWSLALIDMTFAL